MEANEALELANSILKDLGDLPEEAAEFAESVERKVTDMAEWIESKDHCTEKQSTALQNMRAGVDRWLENVRD